MTINQEASGYLPVAGPITYAVTGCDQQQAIEVEVEDLRASRTIAIKRLCGQGAYVFNIEGYLRGLLDFDPAASGTQFICRKERMARIKVRVGQIDTQPIAVTAANREVFPVERLSAAPSSRKMDQTGRDEISLIACDATLSGEFRFSGLGELFALEISALYVENDMISVPVDMGALKEAMLCEGRSIGEFDLLEVEIRADGQPVIIQQYRLQAHNPSAMTVAWVNSFGAVDYYSFPYAQANKVSVKRETGNVAREYVDYSAEVQLLTEAVSDLEDGATIEWLSEMLSSPCIWRLCKEGAQRVNILSAETIAQQEQPMRLKVVMRNAMREKYRNIL